MLLQGELKMKRKNKTIFAVTCEVNNKTENPYFDSNDIRVKISAGTTGIEMSDAICALLSVVLANEEANGSTLSLDGFLNHIRLMMNDMKVGIDKGELND